MSQITYLFFVFNWGSLSWADQATLLSQQADLTNENSVAFMLNFLLIYSPNYLVYWSRVKISSNIQPYNLSRGPSTKYGAVAELFLIGWKLSTYI